MKTIFQETFTHWKVNHAPRMGAALAYYALFSLIPLLVLLTIITSLLFKTSVIEHGIAVQLSSVLGQSSSAFIANMLNGAHYHISNVWSLIITGSTLIVGALGIFSELDSDLDQLWDSPEAPQSAEENIFAKIRSYIMSKVLILPIIPLLALLLIVSILATGLLSLLHTQLAFFVPFGFLITLAQILIPFTLSSILFLIIYRFLPSRRLPWKILILGASMTATLFIVGNILITEYMRLVVQTATFGAASSLVGLLVWTYYSAQVFFLGASFTFVLARERGAIPLRDSAQS